MPDELMPHVITADGWAHEETLYLWGVSVACKPGAGYIKLWDGDPSVAGIYRGSYGLPVVGQELFNLPGPLLFPSGVYVTFHGDAFESILYCQHSEA